MTVEDVIRKLEELKEDKCFIDSIISRMAWTAKTLSQDRIRERVLKVLGEEQTNIINQTAELREKEIQC